MPRNREKITSRRFKIGDTGELRTGGTYEVLALTEIGAVKYVVYRASPSNGDTTVRHCAVSSRELLDPVKAAIAYLNVWRDTGGEYDIGVYTSAEAAEEDARDDWRGFREDNNDSPIAIAHRITIPDNGEVTIPDTHLTAPAEARVWRCYRARNNGDGSTTHRTEYAKTEADMLILLDQGFRCELIRPVRSEED